MMMSSIFCLFALAASALADAATSTSSDYDGWRGQITLRRRLATTTTLADFSVPSAIVNVDVTTDPATWAANIVYRYDGENFVNDKDSNVDPLVANRYNVKFYDFATCSTLLTGTSIKDDQVNSAITMGVDSNKENVFKLPLFVDGASVMKDPAVWFPDATTPTTLSHLKFCAILQIKYAGVLVNVVRTQVEVDVTTDTNGEFSSYSKEVVVRGSVNLQVSSAVSITYAVQVYPCDSSANKFQVGQVPQITPGKAVQFCVELADGAVGAYVASIQSLTYDSNLVVDGADLPAVTIVDTNGPTNSLTRVDCNLVQLGVCFVEFIPAANYFDDVEPLIVSGQAGIAQGQDLYSAQVAAPAVTGGGTRRHLESKRYLTEQGDEAKFAFQIPLSTKVNEQPQEMARSAAALSTKISATTIMFALGSACFWLL